MELLIWIARLAMLGLMIMFLLMMASALRADLRASAEPAREPAPRQTPPHRAPTRPQSVTPTAPILRVLAYLRGPQPTTGRDFPLVSELLIGRDPACQVVVPSTITSKRHARIYPQDGGWFVVDVGSTNGTLLNNQPLLTPARLSPGDHLIVGETEFELR